MKSLIKWFKKLQRRKIKNSDIIHVIPKDNCWGNRIQFLDWDKRTISGHKCPPPDDGDIFAQKMESGKTMLFELVNIRYCSDPRDMFFADAKEVGYKCDLIKKETSGDL